MRLLSPLLPPPLVAMAFSRDSARPFSSLLPALAWLLLSLVPVAALAMLARLGVGPQDGARVSDTYDPIAKDAPNFTGSD